MRKLYVPTLILLSGLLCAVVLHQANARKDFPAAGLSAAGTTRAENDLRDAPNSGKALNGDVKGVLQDIKDGGQGSGVPAVPAPVAVQEPAKGSAASSGAGMNVYFVNVGQGDAEYIELPGGKNALIDGGPEDMKGVTFPDPDHPAPVEDPNNLPDPPLAEFLTQHGIDHIDYLVLTHPHADHYTGLVYVFKHLQVNHFYDTRMNNTDATMDEFVRRQAKKEPNCTTTYPSPGDSLDWDANVQVKVFHSCPKAGKSSDFGDKSGQALNDCSIVLKLTYQDTSVLLTGDMQDDVEAQLVSQYGDQLQADVLKVGHHGSRHSSSQDFLNLVKPKIAYIEVGQNTYGHPTPETLTRLKDMGVTIYRTDQDGTQEYSVGGKAGPAVSFTDKHHKN